MSRKSKGLRLSDLGDGFVDRFWSKVDQSDRDGCWLWTGGAQTAGYGMIWCKAKGGPVLAHQASYVLEHGAVVPGMEIIHSCDTPACVNPAHLKQATHADNLADAASKGRMSSGAAHREKVLAGLGGEWASGENHKRRTLEGMRRTGQLGEQNPRSKLTDNQVSQIRSERAAGVSCRKLGRRYGVSHQTVSGITTGKKRRHSAGLQEA